MHFYVNSVLLIKFHSHTVELSNKGQNGKLCNFGEGENNWCCHHHYHLLLLLIKKAGFPISDGY